MSENNKKGISENFSFKKIKTEMEGMKIIGNIYKFSKLFGYKNDDFEDVLNQIPEFQKEIELLSITPEKFNRYYCSLGWVASNSMNFDLMKEVVEYAENGEIGKGEERLTKYYSSEEMKYLLTSLLGDEAFRVRYKYFQLAYFDTLTEKYYSAIPILLMMLDGATNDVTKSTGFFSENSDLTSWDSIEGHPSGLNELKKLIYKGGRNKTNFEELSIPYRNGILHGRELNYDNPKVAAKCWAAVFAVREWTKSIREGKKNMPLENEPKNFKQQISSLKKSLTDYSNHQKKMKIINQELDKWQKRNLSIGIDIKESGFTEDYKEGTPELELVKFFEFWKAKNYGKIALQIHKYDSYNFKKVPSEVRKYLEGKDFLNFELLSIDDLAPAISTIKVNVNYNFEDQDYRKELLFRFICVDEKNNVCCRGLENSRWTFYEAPLLDIQYSFS